MNVIRDITNFILFFIHSFTLLCSLNFPYLFSNRRVTCTLFNNYICMFYYSITIVSIRTGDVALISGLVYSQGRLL